MSGTEQQQATTKYAWQDVTREDAHKRSAVERVADFLEIHGPYDEETARAQASRCIQCPEPLCVNGCPLSNRIPEWLALTAEGHFLEAASLLHSTGTLPEICARVCPADQMCEGMCVLGGKTEPVSISAIEQFLNQYALDHDGAEPLASPPNGYRVAIIGSGPGGLACADLLSRRGYEVTVFDWRLVPGGLLVNGSPSFRLDRSVVNRRIQMLQERGVRFEMGVKLGDDLAQRGALKEFDAIYLALGARKARELDVPGRDLKGVAQGLSFLVQACAEDSPSKPVLDVKGRRVAVIGGGDMAMDCLRMALRAGASDAVCVYRRDESQLPCSHAEYHNAVEEGARFEFLASPVAVLGNRRSGVQGLQLLRTELGNPDSQGRRSFAVRPGTEFEVPADVVLTALGFESVPFPADTPFSDLPRSESGRLAVDENLMTRRPGVFAGGELVRGPIPILEVVRDARRAAEGIDRHLHPVRD